MRRPFYSPPPISVCTATLSAARKCASVTLNRLQNRIGYFSLFFLLSPGYVIFIECLDIPRRKQLREAILNKKAKTSCVIKTITETDLTCVLGCYCNWISIVGYYYSS